MQVTISGSIGRAPQTLPQTIDGLPVLEAALAVPTVDGKDWFAIQFVGSDLVNVAQVIRKGDTIAIAGELTFERWFGRSFQARCCCVGFAIVRLTYRLLSADV
jgi:single-stranded DNA-binding protein